MLYLVDGTVEIERKMISHPSEAYEEKTLHRLVDADSEIEAEKKFIDHFESETVPYSKVSMQMLMR